MGNLYKIILNEKHFEVIRDMIPAAKKELLIATADLKNFTSYYNDDANDRYSFTDELITLSQKGVIIKLIYNRMTSNFSDEYQSIIQKENNFQLMQCNRNHQKIVMTDREIVYLGSANYTGAGLGGKSVRKRNFETGILVTEHDLINELADNFNKIFTKGYCADCHFNDDCNTFLEWSNR